MARSRSRKSNTRRTPRAHPRGVLEACGGRFRLRPDRRRRRFFIPASKVADAFDGDMVEVTRLPGGFATLVAFCDRLEQPSCRTCRTRPVKRAHECINGAL